MPTEQEIIAAQAAEIERLKNKVASLEDQLYWLRKKMFGKMSEKTFLLIRRCSASRPCSIILLPKRNGLNWMPL